MAGAVVSSLSTLQTHLLGSHFNDGYVLGQIIVNIIFGVAVVGLFALAERSKRIFEINRLSSQGIDLGMGALVWWYTLVIIDLFLHEARISSPFNYYFIAVPITLVKFCAEGLLVANAYRIVVLHLLQQSRKAKITLLVGEVLVLVLIVTALYSVGSLVACQIVWLQLADASTRNSFARPQVRFEAAFYIIQFFLSLFAMAFATILGWLINRATSDVPATIHRLFWACVALFLWCTSEMAFSLKYHLGNKLPARNTGLARDTIFGLFVLTFLILLTLNGDDSTSTDAQINGGGTRPISPKLQSLFTQMQSELRGYLINQLRTRVNDNETTLPQFGTLIEELKGDPTVAFHGPVMGERARLDDNDLNELQRGCDVYLRGLEARFGELAPNVQFREV